MTMSLVPEKVERLRKKLNDKAKREPGYRFYSLYDKVCWKETLTLAYRQARSNRGAAGVDGVRFSDIDSYGESRWLEELQEELEKERYRPQPVKRVMIPKPGGGKRPLGIPTIRDRVVQTAVTIFLEPIFEADLEENAFAYRRDRNAHDALREVQQGLLDRRVHVVDGDLSKYFDTIPHADLLKTVARRVADGKILRLIKLWLKSPVQEDDGKGNRRMSGGKKSKRGIPQGGVISPLLANIYINRFLRHWRKTSASERCGEVINFADDFVILCKSKAQAMQSLELTHRWMGSMGLEVNPDKTRVCYAWKEPFDFLGYTFGPVMRMDTKRWRIGAQPSRKARRRLKEKVNALLYRGNPRPWSQLREELNRLLVGWANYFSYGRVSRVYQAISWHVAWRVRKFLRKRHKVRSPRTSRFGRNEVYSRLGVVDLEKLPQARKMATAKASL